MLDLRDQTFSKNHTDHVERGTLIRPAFPGANGFVSNDRWTPTLPPDGESLSSDKNGMLNVTSESTLSAEPLHMQPF